MLSCHITYLSETSMREKFGRRLQERERFGDDFATEFEVGSYLKYHGNRFTTRFDANSFLYITKAIDYFDMSLGRGDLAEAFTDVQAKFVVLRYSSDWLYPPEQSEELVRALLRNGIDASYVEIKSDYGHDAFLLEVERLGELTRNFLAKVQRETAGPTGSAANGAGANDAREEKVYPLAVLGGQDTRCVGPGGRQSTGDRMTPSRPDFDVIVRMVPAGVRVLDLGCGDGTLLAELVVQKGVQGRGVEVDEANVRACM